MKTNSFRLKLALLSAVISGGLLIAAGVAFWQLTYRMDLARIDRELRNLGNPQLERINGGDHWVRFEGALGFVAGTDRQPSFILWVKHEDRVLHKSKHWPAGIEPESFPELTAYEPPFVLEPGKPLPPPPRRNEPITPRNPELPRKEPQFSTHSADGRMWRVAVMGNPYMTLILGADLSEFMTGMTRLRNAYLAALPVVLLLVAAGAWLVASRALRPVTALTQTVEGITARGLDQRLTTRAHEAEFARLITVFNQMMDRLEKSFHQATRFSADASHELKTPLTILQGELEEALQSATSGSTEQARYAQLLEEIQRLKAITHKLLLLSLADSGRLKLELQPLNLTEAVEEVLEDAGILAGELALEKSLQSGVRIGADADLLQQVLQNLAVNAIKYNRPGGRLRFELTADATHATLRVGNTGPGIAEADRVKVFERFFRGDPSRNRAVTGIGLGLSLAREIVRAHHGDLVLESSAQDWTVFAVRLPAS
ncbi:MAG: HAMP domain-containing protein [Verrucomicrobia bacterium]|nr:HAMP domain-containing protein [Verrucomicrobiota bacterium]